MVLVVCLYRMGRLYAVYQTVFGEFMLPRQVYGSNEGQKYRVRALGHVCSGRRVRSCACSRTGQALAAAVDLQARCLGVWRRC